MNNLPLQAHDEMPPLPEVEELQEPKPRNQFHEQMLKQANEPAKSQRLWTEQSKPIEPCRGYDCPDNTIEVIYVRVSVPKRRNRMPY